MPKKSSETPRQRFFTGTPAGAGRHTGLRLDPERMEAVDAWAAQRQLSRPEAIRQMIDQVLRRV